MSNTDPIEHLGWDATHPNDWRPGYSCDECDAYIETRAKRFVAKAPSFNISRLKADNAGHYTQRELAQEVVDKAKAQGREIERAR
jgi:hypothetical protein